MDTLNTIEQRIMKPGLQFRCRKQHLESRAHSLCLKNKTDINSVFTINCPLCVKDMTNKFHNEQLIFRDYPEVMVKIFNDFKKNVFQFVKPAEQQSDDPILKKYDSLIKQLKNLSKFFIEAAVNLQKEIKGYQDRRRCPNYAQQCIDVFERYSKVFNSKNQLDHEKQLYTLLQIFDLNDNGQFKLKEAPIYWPAEQEKQRAQIYCQAVSSVIDQINEKIKLINDQFIATPEYRQFDRNLKDEILLDEVFIQINEMKSSKELVPIQRTNLMKQAEVSLVQDWVGTKRQFFRIFKAREDGFNNFLKICHNRGPTLIIIKSEYGQRIFGGFTTIPWNAKGDFQRDQDGKSFVFSVTNKTKHRIQKREYATFSYKSGGSHLFAFGGGCDFLISRKEFKSSSNFGHSYELPEGMKFQQSAAKNYLGGAAQFDVEDYEVYIWE